MVRTDGKNLLIAQVLPERLLSWLGSQGRRAFGHSPEFNHIFFGQGEIMRASFAGHIDTEFAGRTDEGKPSPATDMDNVQCTARLSRDLQSLLDGVQFGFDG